MKARSMMDERNVWQVRAAMWELLALSLRYPDELLAKAVASGEWGEAAAEIAGALGLTADAPLRDGGGADERSAGEVLRALRVEATRLFVGAPEPACSPYEGVWRAADDGVQALLFVNPHSMEVERFMRACGLGRPAGTNEPLDHVAAECELLGHLALRAAGAKPPAGAPADAGLPGGSPEAAYRLFLEEHARTWVSRFAERVAAEGREPLYRDAATLLGAFVGASD